jgi:hypothetical protein
MTPIESHISVWLNATTLLVAVGALMYLSLLPYMTKDDE